VKVESLNRKILELGLDEEEAKYFVFISIMGSTPIRSIVNRYNENRVKVYRVLKKLEEKGFVEKLMGRPVKYVAKPLDELFQRSIDDLQLRLNELEATREDTIKEWKRLSDDVETPTEEPRFRINQGRQQVYNLLVQMCEKAEKEVSLVTTESDLRRLSLYGFDDSLRILAKKGVNFNFMTQVKTLDFEEIEEYYNFTPIRHVPLPSPVRFLITDNSEVLITISMDDSMSMTTQNDTGLWTNAESFVSVMKVFFDALWSLGSDVPSVLYGMKTGIKVQETVTLRSKEEFLDHALEAIQDCQTSLDLVIYELEPEILDTLSKNLHQDANCRIISNLTLDTIDAFSKVTEYAEVKHSKSLTEMNLILVDEKKVIVKLPSWGNNTQSIMSNNIYYVDSMQKIFENNWTHANLMNDTIIKLKKKEKSLKIMQQLQSAFNENNYHVESPGIISGESGTNHTFGLIASKEDPQKSIGIDLLSKKEAMTQITMMGAKRTDLGNMKMILITDWTPKEQVTELAKLYRIQIFEESKALKEIQNLI